MAYTKLGQVDLPLYYDLTERAGANAPIVVFVNGWCLSARYWQPCIEALSQKFTCLTYDSRGFGRSRFSGRPIPTNYTATIDSSTDELLALIKKLNLWGENRPLHVVGHSLGAVVAAHFAAKAEAEGKLASLTIVNSGSFDDNEPQGSRLNTFVKIFVRVKPVFEWPGIRESVVRRSAALPIPTNYARILAEDLARSDSRLALELSLSSLEPLNLQRYRHELQALKSPLLLIVGDKDATIPPKGMYNIKKFRPQSDFVAFPDCGHLPMLEQTGRFTQVLEKYFSTSASELVS